MIYDLGRYLSVRHLKLLSAQRGEHLRTNLTDGAAVDRYPSAWHVTQLSSRTCYIPSLYDPHEIFLGQHLTIIANTGFRK